MEKEPLDITIYNHMDIANQIDNSWSRDSILAFVNKQKNYKYSIRFKKKEKLKLKKEFINPLDTSSTKRHNKKIINLVFGYLIFKIIQEIKIPLTRVLICPDHRPTKQTHHYIQKISNSLGKPNLTGEIDISFINRKKYDVIKNTPAHKWAKKILQRKKGAKSNIDVNYKELQKIINQVL